MTERISTELAIDASPSRVWQVLADFSRYPEWNPFILELRGIVRQGATLPYRFEFPRGLRLWASATILRLEPAKELRWAAHALTPRVFNGEHYFTMTQTSECTTLFRHGEIFTGFLLPSVWPIIRAYGPDIYASLNIALKRRVEGLPA